MFTKYGYFNIGFAAIIFFIAIVISFFINNNIIKAIIIIIPLVFLVFTLNFFRDPERTTPKRDDVIISPADGKVVIIKEVVEKEFIKDKATMISIFMSPLNVHVNRIPVTGKLDYLKYYTGKFIAAFDDKASDENERGVYGITSPLGKVLFTQVAGTVARRIVYDFHQGDSVKIGERFGMIKFGSKVDVIVPAGMKVMVKKGEMVKAGETILFEKQK